MLSCVWNCCCTLEAIPGFTNKFSINSEVSTAILLQGQSSWLACAALSCFTNEWKKKSEGLASVGVSLNCLLTSAAPWLCWALLLTIYGSSSRFLPDFMHLSLYLEVGGVHTVGWHIVLASCESAKTMSIPNFCISFFHFESISGATAVPYVFKEGKKSAAPIRQDQLLIHLPVLEKKSYRITSFRGNKGENQ